MGAAREAPTVVVDEALDVVNGGVELGGAEVVEDLLVLGNVDFESFDRAASGGAGACAEGRWIGDWWRADVVLDAVILLEEQCGLGSGEGGTPPERVRISTKGAGMGEKCKTLPVCMWIGA